MINNLEISEMIEVPKTDDIVADMKYIIRASQKTAYQAVNVALVYRNWLIGQRIADEILDGEDRAEYGSEVIKNLSRKLTEIFGKGFA